MEAAALWRPPWVPDAGLMAEGCAAKRGAGSQLPCSALPFVNLSCGLHTRGQDKCSVCRTAQLADV